MVFDVDVSRSIACTQTFPPVNMQKLAVHILLQTFKCDDPVSTLKTLSSKPSILISTDSQFELERPATIPPAETKLGRLEV